MNDYTKEIPELLAEGEKFTFQNFSTKSNFGYPNSFSAEWLVWTHRVGLLSDRISDSSPIRHSIKSGLNVKLLGFGEDHFSQAKELILNGLRAAAKLFGPAKDIPASDRVVTIDHNSEAYSEAVGSLEKLIQSVREINDYPDQEDKEQQLAELSAGRELISAARVRIQAVKVVLERPLRWFMEKFSGAIVSQLAGLAWKAVQHLLNL